MTNLRIGTTDLAFFIDECGHELFKDPDYPVFGLGGCAAYGANIELQLRQPWTEMKNKNFGDAGTPLHASDLTNPTQDQIEGIANFFKVQKVARFAATINDTSIIPDDTTPYQIIAGALKNRFCEVAGRASHLPQKVFFVFEDSERGNSLAEAFFNFSFLHYPIAKVPVEWAFLPKSAGDPCLEIADFIINAAGGQSRRYAEGNREPRKDFEAIFRKAPDGLVSFIQVDKAN